MAFISSNVGRKQAQTGSKRVQDMRGRTTFSKAAPLALSVVLLLALFGAARAQSVPSCTSTGADVNTKYKSSSESASFYTSFPYGTCGTCYLSLYASAGMVKDQPGKPTKSVTANVYFSCYDYCDGSGNGNSIGGSYESTDASGINIKKNSASVQTTLALQYSYGSASTPASAVVSVQAQPDGSSDSSSKCTSAYTYTTPCAVVTTSRSNSDYASQSATFTGTITLGSTVYTLPVQGAYYSSGSLSKNDQNYRTVTKTH